MEIWRKTLVFMCCIFGPTVGRKNAHEEGDTLDKINSARCTSRCLALYLVQLTAFFKHLQSDGVLEWCESHRRCSQCLQPCKELWETRRTLSQKPCEKHHECAASWAFVASLQAQKQGDCPPAQRASGFAAACVESCTGDRECSGTKKCCPNGCGHTCQAPANLYKGVPPRPRREMSFQEGPLDQLEVSWTSRYNVTIEPVLYVLQRRWNYGIHPSEDTATSWQSILMTMAETASLGDVRPHRWYQFRVSAVNSQGTRGFSTPSKHFIYLRDPFLPAMPKNLRQRNSVVSGDCRVSTILLWDHPRDEDLFIHHYKVSWRASGPRGGYRDKQEGTRVTEGAVCEVELEGLQVNTHYVVQVQAVAFWGQKRLRSRKSQLTFTTPKAEFVSEPSGNPAMGQSSNELPSSHPSLEALRLEATTPLYDRHQLQVKLFWRRLYQDPTTFTISWYPEVCTHNATRTKQTATVQGTQFVLTDLLFACKYSVAVRALSLKGERSEGVTSVTTPHCWTLKDRGANLLPCGVEVRPSPAHKVLLRPEKLTAAFRTVNGSLEGELSWQLSNSSPEPGSVSGLQVSWAWLSISSTASHTLIAQSQILPPYQTSLTVENMHPQSVYKVQVQVLSAGSSGPSVVKLLHTPELNGTVL